MFTFSGRYYVLHNSIRNYNWNEDLLIKTLNYMGHHACQQQSHVNISNKTVVLLMFSLRSIKQTLYTSQRVVTENWVCGHL